MTTLELREHCKNTFTTTSGKVMLFEIMKQGYFFNSGELEITEGMPQAVGKRNLVNWILSLFGCADNAEMNFMAVIDGLGNLPILSKPNKKEDL